MLSAVQRVRLVPAQLVVVSHALPASLASTQLEAQAPACPVLMGARRYHQGPAFAV
jgi:hypothetical protein